MRTGETSVFVSRSSVETADGCNGDHLPCDNRRGENASDWSYRRWSTKIERPVYWRDEPTIWMSVEFLPSSREWPCGWTASCWAGANVSLSWLMTPPLSIGLLGRLEPVLVLSRACSDVSGYCDGRRMFRPSCLPDDSSTRPADVHVIVSSVDGKAVYLHQNVEAACYIAIL